MVDEPVALRRKYRVKNGLVAVTHSGLQLKLHLRKPRGSGDAKKMPVGRCSGYGKGGGLSWLTSLWPSAANTEWRTVW